MLGQQIPFRLAKEQVYLGTTKVLALINAPSLVHKSKKAIDTLLEAHGISLDDAFCYEGRQRGYISTSALRVILKSEPMAKFAERDVMLEAISNIESSATSLCESLTLPLNASSISVAPPPTPASQTVVPQPGLARDVPVLLPMALGLGQLLAR